jgi:hypothetical protein
MSIADACGHNGGMRHLLQQSERVVLEDLGPRLPAVPLIIPIRWLA